MGSVPERAQQSFIDFKAGSYGRRAAHAQAAGYVRRRRFRPSPCAGQAAPTHAWPSQAQDLPRRIDPNSPAAFYVRRLRGRIAGAMVANRHRHVGQSELRTHRLNDPEATRYPSRRSIAATATSTARLMPTPPSAAS